MSQSRAKINRRLVDQLIVQNPEALEQHCRSKFNMPNRNGYRQHRTINPRRQVKKMLRTT